MSLMSEPICEAVDYLGECLEFSAFNIKAIPGIDLHRLIDDVNSPYTAEVKEVTFSTSAQNIAENGVKIDDTFTIEDGIYKFTMKIVSNPRTDLTGWAKFEAAITAKTKI